MTSITYYLFTCIISKLLIGINTSIVTPVILLNGSIFKINSSTSIKLKQYCQLHQTMKWILTFTLLTFMSLVLAEGNMTKKFQSSKPFKLLDYSCPDGKSKKSITIKKDESFNFDIAPG